MDQFRYIFLWLVAAFLVGDYPLQLNVVFRVRYKYRFGGLLHVAIHFLTGLVFIIPYLHHWRMWVFYGATIAIHYLVDTVNKKNIWMWFGDQAIHLVLIGVVAWLCRDLQPFALPAAVARWYFDPALPVYVIGYVLAAFAGTIFIYFIKMTFVPDYGPRPILTYEKATGVIARAATLTAVILGFKISPAFFVVAPIPEMIRLAAVLAKRGDGGDHRNVYPLDVGISFVFTLVLAAGLAVGLRLWTV